MKRVLPIPPYLPAPPTPPPGGLPELALELYRQIAGAAREREEQRRSAQQETERQTREAERTLARLAAVRFELARLLARILPALAEGGREDIVRILELFARSWDAELERCRIEVRDVAGEPVTDELAAVIEVEAAVPDPTTREAKVRETLSPLVVWDDRVVGVARVITSVPILQTMESDLVARPEEAS